MDKKTTQSHPSFQETQKLLSDMAFLQREENRYHHTYGEELLQYEYLRNGDYRSIEESIRMFRNGINGKLSSDPVRDKKYLFVASTTLATRFAIEGGMPEQDAYNLSDHYIQEVDLLRSVQDIYELQTRMITDFTQQLHELRKRSSSAADQSGNNSFRSPDHKTYSKAISDCIEYIYLHLHEQISVTRLSEVAGLSGCYLITRFQKEVGTTPAKWIQDLKIETAKNLLVYTNRSVTDIGAILGFSSSSHFVSVFRSMTGATPLSFRNKNYNTHLKWADNQNH